MHLEGGADGLSTSPSSHSVENTETAFHFLRTGQGAHREPQRSPLSSDVLVGNSSITRWLTPPDRFEAEDDR
jgi:hypothetical protein